MKSEENETITKN